MRKIFIILLSLITVVVVSVFLFFYPFAQGVVADADARREEIKNSMVVLSFQAVIIEKEIKYEDPRLTMLIDKSEDLPKLFARHMAPYYMFMGKDTLMIKISEALYSKVNLGDSLIKNSMSTKLLIKEKTHWNEVPWLEEW